MSPDDDGAADTGDEEDGDADNDGEADDGSRSLH